MTIRSDVHLDVHFTTVAVLGLSLKECSIDTEHDRAEVPLYNGSSWQTRDKLTKSKEVPALRSGLPGTGPQKPHLVRFRIWKVENHP